MNSTLIAIILFLTFSSAHAASEGSVSKVLFVGDSHSYGNFGKVLDKYLRTRASDVLSISSCGSSPSTWTTDKGNFKTTNCGYWRRSAIDKEIRVKSHQMNSFSQEFDTLKPDVTVISLGTNILASEGDIQREKKHIEKMIQYARKGGSQCVWIGPPDLARDPYKKNLPKGIAEIKAVVEKNDCIYIDSARLIKYPQGSSDGIHYGPQDATKWGEAVQKALDSQWSQIEAASQRERRKASAGKSLEGTSTTSSKGAK
ncbi:MAG: SGNH/GDSL hydrolase family protein [Bdellovibrio sp.]|nr:SGNH/GDSL hydrolase family protein [Bdellovibrio sp.]